MHDVLTACNSGEYFSLKYVFDLTYLDGTSSNMTIVRKAGGKGRSIVESVQRLALCEFKLLLESIDVLPVLKHLLFLIGEVRSLGNYDLESLESVQESLSVSNLPLANLECM
jgi:hypothetical protein